MDRDNDRESAFVRQFEMNFAERDEVHRRATINDENATPRAGILIEISGHPIRLEFIEFQILTFLARSPYRAFSRKQIVDAVGTEQQPVTEDELPNYIMSLRDKLGLFSDYVQTVPYVGYRFKD